MLRLGHMAAGMLAAIPDRADLAWADRGVFAIRNRRITHRTRSRPKWVSGCKT